MCGEDQDTPYQEMLDKLRNQIDATSEYVQLLSSSLILFSSVFSCVLLSVICAIISVIASFLSRNIATVKGSQSFFRKSLEKLHNNHKCPLCMRGFEEQESLDNTIRLVRPHPTYICPHVIVI